MLVTLGYSGWSPGQLETEIARNDWLTIPAGSGAGDILWNTPLLKRKDAAIRLLGIEPMLLTGQAGHA
jgi:putative transcriptional regulator